MKAFMRPSLRFGFRVLTGLLLLAPGTVLGQGQVVGPGGGVVTGSGPNWNTWVDRGQAQVTRDNPRLGWGGYGEGSLRLSVSGELIDGQYPDWAFWYRYAGGSAENSLATLNSGGSFGLLSALTNASFDWFRVGFPGWDTPCPVGGNQPIPPCDWAYKTPVVRLQLAEMINNVVVQTELIWEGYFNQDMLGGTTPVDQWVSSSGLQNGNFWYVRPAVGAGNYTTIGNGTCDLNPFSFWQGNVEANALSQLLGVGGCIGSDARVIGIGIGVGSQWPLEYLAYADNVQLEFNGQRVLDANFDYVVPEPATWVLFGIGLTAIGGVAARRRRLKTGE
jgi:hypothetical protein